MLNKNWRLWPTHWAGGSRSVQVNGHNTMWIESDEHGTICLMHPGRNGAITEKTYALANQIVEAVNAVYNSQGKSMLAKELHSRATNSDVRAGNALIFSQAADAIDRLEAQNVALAKVAQEMLDYIEMKLAHTGPMSVEQIKDALVSAKRTSSVETAHHLGCPATTRRVDLDAVRKVIAGAPKPDSDTEAETLRSILRLIIADLPAKRDWLNPDVERMAREAIKQ